MGPDDQFYAMKAQQQAGGGGVWKPQFQKQSWGKGKGKGKKAKVDPQKTVWVGGLPAGCTFKELLEIGKTAGAKWAEVGTKSGTGAMGFGTPEEAAASIAALNGAPLNGASIVVDVWEKPPKE